MENTFKDMQAINKYICKLIENDIDEKTAREIIALWIHGNEFEPGEVIKVLEKEFKKTSMKE